MERFYSSVGSSWRSCRYSSLREEDHWRLCVLTELGSIPAAYFVFWCLGVRPVGHLASHEDTREMVSERTRVSRTSLSDGTHVGLYAPQADRADAKTSAPLQAPNVEGPSGDAVTQSEWGYREENRDRKKVTVWRCVCDDPPPPPVSKKPEVR